MGIKYDLFKVIGFFLLIPLVVITYYGAPYYWEKKGIRIQEKKIKEEELRKAKKLTGLNQTFGPWKIQELKEDGWTKKYTRVAPAKGLSRVWMIDSFKTAEFSTNPPGQDVYFQNNGKRYKLHEDPGKLRSRKFYFGSNTGERVTIYIIEAPFKK